MKIGGLQKFTLIDYPEKIACTVFLSGCNFRCPWCYSPELVLPEEIERNRGIDKEDFFSFLRKRKGRLEGVVICGGEPTIHKDLFPFIKEIRKEGFPVKIDTNGSYPEVLEELIKESLIDYIAMDVKLSPENYGKITVEENYAGKIKKSIKLLLEDRVNYEFRTTLVPGVHDIKEVKEIGEEIKGAKRYFLQNFLPEKNMEKSFLKEKPFTKEELEEFKKAANPFVKMCEIR